MSFTSYNKIDLKNLSHDSKTKNIKYNDVNLVLIGSRMVIYNVTKISDILQPYNINLRFKSLKDNFAFFVNDLDEFYISKLQQKYKNIDNSFISSLRRLLSDEDKNNVYIRLVCSPHIEFYDQNKQLIENIEKYDLNNIEAIPLFKVSLKTTGDFKYIEWDLIQLKIFDNELNIPHGTCVLDDEEDEELISN